MPDLAAAVLSLAIIAWGVFLMPKVVRYYVWDVWREKR